MKKKECDVAIIGGGHNGLICAAYLARAGLKVIVCEARHECGGGLDALEYGGFRYQPHAIYHMMAEIMPAYKDLELDKKGVKYIYPDVQAAYISKDQKPLILYKDAEKTAQYISATFSEKDGETYRRMHAEFTEFAEKIVIPLTYFPSVPPIEQVQIMNAAEDDVGRRFNEIAEHTPLEILDMYEYNEPVKAAIINLFAMWGLPPFEALGYLFPLYVNRMTNSALCRGGSHRLCSGIHRAVIEAGGEIMDSSEVVKITLKDGRVDGLVTWDGVEIKAKAVASTVDPKQSFLKFFEQDEIPSFLVDSAERWEWEKTTYFGLHLAMKEAPVYIGSEHCEDANKAMVTLLGINDTDELLDHIAAVEDGEMPDHLFGHTTVPSIFDPIMAPPGYHTGRWESMVPFDADWENISDDFAQKCFNEWKEYAPNLNSIGKFVYPPTYIEKKFLNMVRGSIKQGAYMPLQMGYFRPNDSCSQGFTPIEGFYLCGASSYPGGMILGGGGYKGANIIAEDLEVKKTWEEPEILKQTRGRGLYVD